MFGSRRKRIRADHADSLIGPNTEIQGDIRFTGDLVILGTVLGNVMSEVDTGCVVSLSESGRVEGEIRVPNVVINGTVIGNVFASEHLQLAGKARITGDVHYHLIEMEMGAEVNGSLIHAGEAHATPLQLTHNASDQQADGAVDKPAPDAVDAKPVSQSGHS